MTRGRAVKVLGLLALLRTIVVGAGLGTSILPLRFGAPPDFWVLSLGGGR